MPDLPPQSVRKNRGAFFRLACLTPVFVLAVSFYFWHEGREVEDTSIQRACEDQAVALAELIRLQIDEDMTAVKRMGKRWEAAGGTPRDLWLADARAYVSDNPELKALGWVDHHHVIQWIVPLEGNEEAEGLTLNFESRRADALARAKNSDTYALTRPIELVQGGLSILGIYSLKENGKPNGFISAAVDPYVWINKAIGQQARHYHVRVTEYATVLYLRDEDGDENHQAATSEWVAAAYVDVGGIHLRVDVRPTLLIASTFRSAAPLWILGSGFLLAILLALTVCFWQGSLNREFALQRTQEQFNRAISGTSDGLWEWTVGTETVWWAPRFKELLGYDPYCSEDEFPGLLQTFRDHLHPDDNNSVWEAVDHHLETNEDYDVEYRLRIRTGEYRWFRARGRSAVDQDQGKRLMSGSIQDITERKTSREEIAQRNKDLETLLYVTSHDLREPLRAIRNFAGILETDHASQLDEEGRDFLRRVVRGSDRLHTLLDDILTLSRAQRENVSDQIFAMRDVIEKSLSRLGDTIESTQAQISIEPDLPMVKGDPKWIAQAVYNLLANALKFNQPGESPHVEIAAYRPEGDSDRVGIVMRDRGPGIPMDNAERIFNLFQRAVGRDIPGTGAGLAIVRQIVERHHGRVWHQSREGGGSEFFLLLPAANESHQPDETQSTIEAIV